MGGACLPVSIYLNVRPCVLAWTRSLCGTASERGHGFGKSDVGIVATLVLSAAWSFREMV